MSIENKSFFNTVLKLPLIEVPNNEEAFLTDPRCSPFLSAELPNDEINAICSADSTETDSPNSFPDIIQLNNANGETNRDNTGSLNNRVISLSKTEQQTVIKIKKTKSLPFLRESPPLRIPCSTLNCPHGLRSAKRVNILTGKHDKCGPCSKTINTLVKNIHKPHQLDENDDIKNCPYNCVERIQKEFSAKMTKILVKKAASSSLISLKGEVCQNDYCKTKCLAIGPNSFDRRQRLDQRCYDFVRNQVKYIHDKHLIEDPTAEKSPLCCASCLEKTRYYCVIERKAIAPYVQSDSSKEENPPSKL